jgi:hypothetical protein
MLTTRPGKRDKVGFFNTDLIYDILDEGNVIGSLTYDKKHLRGSVSLGDQTYTVERSTDRHEERLYQALIRVMTGAEKPPANPISLKNAAGETLALAEHRGQGFAVSRGNESFSLRKPSGMPRPFHLYRDGSDQSLGSVGQEKFFSKTLHMKLPPGFDPAFQLFLLVLLLNLSMKSLENSTN